MQTRSFEELVRLHEKGRITWLQFVELSEDAEDYHQWCRDHVLTPDEKNAQVYLEQIEPRLTAEELDPADYEQLQNKNQPEA